MPFYNDRTSVFADGIQTVPCALASRSIWPGNGADLLTAGGFTVTVGGGATPIFDYIGGRPCFAMTNTGSTATDGCQFQVPQGIYQLQAGKRAIIKTAIRMTTTTQEFRFGWCAIDTSMIASDSTDLCVADKLTGVTAIRGYTRKASGTALAGSSCPMTLAADTWYDLAIECVGVSTGVGYMNLYYGSALSPGGQLNSMRIDFASGFPDTVDLAPSFAWRAGSAANVSGYFSYFGWSIEG